MASSSAGNTHPVYHTTLVDKYHQIKEADRENISAIHDMLFRDIN